MDSAGTAEVDVFFVQFRVAYPELTQWTEDTSLDELYHVIVWGGDEAAIRHGNKAIVLYADSDLRRPTSATLKRIAAASGQSIDIMYEHACSKMFYDQLDPAWPA